MMNSKLALAAPRSVQERPDRASSGGGVARSNMDRSEASALADLQMHWDEAYVIALDGDVWSARYRNSADELRAHTSTELRELIRSDYAYRQKADLVAYDPEEDYDDDGNPEGADNDEPAPRDGETGADNDDGEHDEGAAAGPPDAEADNFATIRGERMSI